jgi:hypothetical protein
VDWEGISADRLGQDVVDWFIQYARLNPLQPVPTVQLLAELRREILAAIEVATAMERARCASLVEAAGHPQLASRLRLASR